ncbi:MAG: hypothetical protein ACJZ87_08655 [Paracoccaceae bacterium]
MKLILLRVSENLPSIAFLIALRLGQDIITSALIGMLLSWLVLFVFYRKGLSFDPIVLGINVNFASLAPFITLFYLVGLGELAQIIVKYAGPTVLLYILLTDAVFVWGLKRDIVREKTGGPAATWRRSYVLVGLCGLACVWSFVFAGAQFLSVGLPIMGLFLSRGFMGGRSDPMAAAK